MMQGEAESRGKTMGAKLKTRVGRSAFYISIISFITLMTGIAASYQHSQSKTMTMRVAGIPFLHFLFIAPVLGMLTALLGGTIWLTRMVLHRMWFNRYIVALVIDFGFNSWGAVAGAMAIHDRHLLSSRNSFDGDLKTQMMIGTMSMAAHSVICVIFTLALIQHRRLYVHESGEAGRFTQGGNTCCLWLVEDIKAFIGAEETREPYALPDYVRRETESQGTADDQVSVVIDDSSSEHSHDYHQSGRSSVSSPVEHSSQEGEELSSESPGGSPTQPTSFEIEQTEIRVIDAPGTAQIVSPPNMLTRDDRYAQAARPPTPPLS